MPCREQVVGELDVAGIEDFQLGQHAGLADAFGHDAQVARRVDDDRIIGIHRVEVEAAEFGSQRHDMFDALLRRQDAGAGAAILGSVSSGMKRPPGPVVRLMIRSSSAGADALNHFTVVGDLHARPPVGIADMNVGDRRACAAGRNTGFGDLFGSAGQTGMLLDCRMVASDRTTNDCRVCHCLSFLPASRPAPLRMLIFLHVCIQ